MNENKKTIALLSIAVVVVLVAWLSRPGDWSGEQSKVIGEKLTAGFDPLEAASLEIAEYDESTATVHPFQVSLADYKGSRRWSIPSHSDYPADADKQVAGAATALMDLKILSVEGDDTQADHEKFGVVDPDPKKLKSGATGVGLRATIRGNNNKELVSLIIGKEVPGRPGLRYVRRTGQDQIYTVAVSTDNLSTKFDRWIEKNLLKFNALDMQRFDIRDYSVDVLQSAIVQKAEMSLGYSDQSEPHWRLLENRRFTKDKKWESLELNDDEELNAAKLDELKTAMDDLKIVDVVPKPQGLSADLKASADFRNKEESLLTLMNRGFFPSQIDNQIELFSKEGEVRCVMKDGVEYVLRFGDIATDADTGPTKNEAKDKDQDGQDKDGKKSATGQNRYLFVMAEFNPEAIPKPQLEPLPEAKPEGEQPPAADSKDTAKSEEKAADAKETPADAKTGEKTEKTPAKADDKASLEAERQRIEKDNKRKQEEYEEKLSAGKKHVEELNARFADWYYIISDNVYRKIRLGREEIIKKKEQKDAKTGDKNELSPTNPTIDLNNLQEQGPGGK